MEFAQVHAFTHAPMHTLVSFPIFLLSSLRL